MNLHLQEISTQVTPGWHQTGRELEVPDNIVLLPFPAYSPELNPMENVGEFLRANKLFYGVKCFTATVPVSGHASFIGTVGNLPQTDKIRNPQHRPRDAADFRAGARPTKGDCVLRKLLFAAVAASTLLSATLAFAQPAGFTPTRYGTKAFETNSQQSQSMTSGEKGSGQPQIESGSVSGKVTPVQSHKTPG